MSIDILIRKLVPRFFRVILSLPVLELLKLTGGDSRQGKRNKDNIWSLAKGTIHNVSYKFKMPKSNQ